MSGPNDSLPSNVAQSLQQGVTALLASRTTAWLLSVVPDGELLMLTLALLALVHGLPRWAVVRRLSDLVQHALSSIALNTLLSASVLPNDPGLTVVNLVAVFMLASALQHGASRGAARYLLVSNLSACLKGFGASAVAVAWTMAFVPYALGTDPVVVQLAGLVTVQTFTEWIQAGVPPGLHLPTVLLLVYFFAPFAEEFPALTSIFDFAVFCIANDLGTACPPWSLAVGLWVVWRLEPDRDTRYLAGAAGASIAVVVAMDALASLVSADPILVITALLVAMGILLEA